MFCSVFLNLQAKAFSEFANHPPASRDFNAIRDEKYTEDNADGDSCDDGLK